MKSDSKDFIRNLITKMPGKHARPLKNVLSAADKEAIRATVESAVSEEVDLVPSDMEPTDFAVSSEKKAVVRDALNKHFSGRNKDMSEVYKLANAYFNDCQWVARNAHKINRVLQTIEDFEKSGHQQ